MTTAILPCDIDPTEPCSRVVPEVVADLSELIGKPVLVTSGSMAFHGWLDAVVDDSVLVVRAAGWTRRLPLASVIRITESKRIPGDRSHTPVAAGPAKASVQRAVAEGPARVCCRCRTATTSYTTESVALAWGGRRKFHTCATCATRKAS